MERERGQNNKKRQGRWTGSQRVAIAGQQKWLSFGFASLAVMPEEDVDCNSSRVSYHATGCLPSYNRNILKRLETALRNQKHKSKSLLMCYPQLMVIFMAPDVIFPQSLEQIKLCVKLRKWKWWQGNCVKIKMLASSCRESFNCEVSAVSITIRHSEILFTHNWPGNDEWKQVFFFKNHCWK